MSTELIPVPCSLAMFSARPPALFLPYAKAADRFFDFFTGNIRNKNTRRAYYKAVCCFAEWYEAKGLRDLAGVKPFYASRGGRDRRRQREEVVPHHGALYRLTCSSTASVRADGPARKMLRVSVTGNCR